MFQRKFVGAFIFFLTWVGVRCESGEDKIEDLPSASFRDYPFEEEIVEGFPASRFRDQTVGEGDIVSDRPPSRFRGHTFNYDTYDLSFDHGCDHETRVALAEVKSEVQHLERLLVGLRQKLDPDFKKPPRRDESCPPGFHYARLSHSCYKVVYEEHSWTSADQRCRELHPNAHLVAITKKDESNGLKAYLQQELTQYRHLNICQMHSWGDTTKMLWTSGQRLNETSCTEPFVWKLSNDVHLPLSYSNWNQHEPNCVGNAEQCIHVRPTLEFRWNDLNCDKKLCPLCEYDPL